MVLLYGAPAVGKYTTGRRLSKITGFKFLHHHAIRDLVFQFFDFDRENLNGQKVWESLYFNFSEKIMREKINVILTHTHARNRVYATGLSSLKFVERIAKIVKRSGGIFYPVHLICEEKELLKRVVQPSRKRYNKSNTVRELTEMIKSRDYRTPLNVKNNFIINNTRIPAKRTAKVIKDHFNL